MAALGSKRPHDISNAPADPNEVPKEVHIANPVGVPAGRTAATSAQLTNTPGTRYLIGDTGHPQAPALAAGETSLERHVSSG